MLRAGDWQAANDHPKGPTDIRSDWVRPRGGTWYRRTAPTGDGTPSVEAPPEPRFITVGRVIGCAIYTPHGRRLGRVTEIAMDEATGEVAFVVVGRAGFLGIGARQARAPWAALSYRPQRAGYVLDLPESEIEALRSGAASREWRLR